MYWELAPHLKEQAEEFGTTELEKEAWVSSVLLEWGSCGRIVYSDKLPVGFVLYAPPNGRAACRGVPHLTAEPGRGAAHRLLRAPEFRGAASAGCSSRPWPRT